MGFLNRDANIEELRKRSSKIPGTADWIKVNIKSDKEKIAVYKATIMEKVAKQIKK